MTNNSKSTPYFIIDQDCLSSGLRKLNMSIEAVWPNYIIGYSYKTNALPWIIKFFRDNGCYAEVVSDDEYLLAKSHDAGAIIYNGIAKSKDTFIEAIKNHNIVNIDANYEIDWLDELEPDNYNIGIRVNFDLESMCPGQTQCGVEGERFGFCYENGELKHAIEAIRAKGFKVNGLHLHKSSKTRMPEIYKAIAETAVKISNDLDLDLDFVDIGGGFFGGLESKPQFPVYFDIISSILKTKFDPEKTKLIVEPGMALIGPAVDYVTTVLDIKKSIRNTFVITDGSRTQIDPLMTKHNYFFDIIYNDDVKSQRAVINKQIVSGFTCMEHDRLFEILDSYELVPNDQIIYHKVGAYTMCLMPLFIKWFPDVYVRSVDGTSLVRERWSTEEFISRCRGDGL